MNGSEWGLQNAAWDLLKFKHGQILTTFVEDGAVAANGEKSKIDWYGPLSQLFSNNNFYLFIYFYSNDTDVCMSFP